MELSLLMLTFGDEGPHSLLKLDAPNAGLVPGNATPEELFTSGVPATDEKSENFEDSSGETPLALCELNREEDLVCRLEGDSECSVSNISCGELPLLLLAGNLLDADEPLECFEEKARGS